MNDLMVYSHEERKRPGRARAIGPIAASCKLACETKAATILQLSLSSELLKRLSVRGRFKRQPNIKLCAIRTRAEIDFSVMPFDDDSVGDDESKSRA